MNVVDQDRHRAVSSESGPASCIDLLKSGSGFPATTAAELREQEMRRMHNVARGRAFWRPNNDQPWHALLRGPATSLIAPVFFRLAVTGRLGVLRLQPIRRAPDRYGEASRLEMIPDLQGHLVGERKVDGLWQTSSSRLQTVASRRASATSSSPLESMVKTGGLPGVTRLIDDRFRLAGVWSALQWARAGIVAGDYFSGARAAANVVTIMSIVVAMGAFDVIGIGALKSEPTVSPSHRLL